MSAASSTETAYRDNRDRLENAVKKLLIERVAKDHADEVSRKATLATYFEDSARFLQRTMVALNRLTSVLIKEEAVNTTLQGQKNYIDQNIAKMVNNTHMTGQQAEQLFNGICNMAVCQWKIKREALRSMPSNRDPSTINPPYYNHNNHDPHNKGRTLTPEIPQHNNDQGPVSMVEDMKVLTKQQIKSSDMIMSTVEAMRVLIEQQDDRQRSTPI
jgi:hypothetical protein